MVGSVRKCLCAFGSHPHSASSFRGWQVPDLLTELEARRLVVCASRVLDAMGLVEAFGHVSVRMTDGTLLLTPGRALCLVGEEDLIVLGPGGEIIKGRPEAAPLERWLHLAIYRARGDVNAICRTHSRMASVLAAVGVTVRTSHGFGGMLGTEVPVHDETDLITTEAMGWEVAKTLGECRAVLLRGNGALATGETLQAACVRAIYLEEAAWMQVAAAGVGGAIPFTPDELRARSRWYEVEVGRAWEYYCTKFR